MPKARRKTMTRAPKIMGGALPGPGSGAAMGVRAGQILKDVLLKPVAGPEGGRLAEGSNLGQRILSATPNSSLMKRAQRQAFPVKDFQSGAAPKPPVPKDTSAKPVVSTYKPLVPAKVRYPAPGPSLKPKGRPGRGGARPI
jgi:hypothetical protein